MILWCNSTSYNCPFHPSLRRPVLSN